MIHHFPFTESFLQFHRIRILRILFYVFIFCQLMNMFEMITFGYNSASRENNGMWLCGFPYE